MKSEKEKNENVKNYFYARNTGITLITLVITIIILLILAGITIGTLKNMGLLDKTKLAKTKYINAQQKEDDIINEYYSKIKNAEQKPNIKDEEYTYTGKTQVYIVKYTGIYNIQLWGASGGDVNGLTGGNGAYTSGNIELNAGEKIYVYVGAQGSNDNWITAQNYNGGGGWGSNIGTDRQGGGATDVRLVDGNWNEQLSLISRIMVAAGGGGAGYYSSNEHGSRRPRRGIRRNKT